jgi:hypothetical protein
MNDKRRYTRHTIMVQAMLRDFGDAENDSRRRISVTLIGLRERASATSTISHVQSECLVLGVRASERRSKCENVDPSGLH